MNIKGRLALLPEESPAHTDDDNPTNIVKAGVVYQQGFTESERVALESFIRTKANNILNTPTTSGLTIFDIVFHDSIYEPLTEHQEVRILQLAPATFGERISCSLHVCSIQFEYKRPQKTRHAVSSTTGQPIWYTALSYVWGDPSLVNSIECNGTIFRTTQNLYNALQYLRKTDTSVYLWIDQICINQNDLQEKAQQVHLMSKIYQRAWSTLAWLGEEADNSRGAIRTLPCIQDALRYRTVEEPLCTEDFERLSLPSADSQIWRDLGKFFSRPWFQRLWIIQETVLSMNMTFMCGQECLTLEDLSLAAICITDNNLDSLFDVEQPAKDEPSESGCTRLRTIYQMMIDMHTQSGRTSLLGALVDGRSSLATDPRDKVFGIMGMTSAFSTLYPDYESTVADVYLEAARKTLDPGSSPFRLFTLLCCVDHEQPSTRTPSWVPDWSLARQTASFSYAGLGRGIYRAAGDSRTDWAYHPNGTSLLIHAFCFDTIVGIGTLIDPNLQDLVNKGTPTHSFVLESIEQVVENCRDTNWNEFEAFWTTFVAGKDNSGVRKAPTDYAAIFALLIDTATGHSQSFSDQPKFARKLTLANLEKRRPNQIYRQMQVAFKAALKGRRFGTTSRGYMGLFPRGTTIGDQVCIISGGYVPFVLRPSGGDHSFLLVGECYQHGVMDGQMMQTADFRMQEIEIV